MICSAPFRTHSLSSGLSPQSVCLNLKSNFCRSTGTSAPSTVCFHPSLKIERPASLKKTRARADTSSGLDATSSSMKILFVEMGVGYDQHGQDITKAAMRACRDAISSNSIAAFRSGALPGVNIDQMKIRIKLGVPHCTQSSLDIERVKSIFPYGQIIDVEVVDGGLICSSGVCLEEMGDKNDDCYIVNTAVYVGY